METVACLQCDGELPLAIEENTQIIVCGDCSTRTWVLEGNDVRGRVLDRYESMSLAIVLFDQGVPCHKCGVAGPIRWTPLPPQRLEPKCDRCMDI